MVVLALKIIFMLSLRFDSTGESTGVCLVNLVSNWEVSSALVWKWNRLAMEKRQWIIIIYQSRLIRRFISFMENVIPVNILKEIMSFNSHSVVRGSSQSLRCMSFQQSSKKISSICSKISRNDELPFQNFLYSFLTVISCEWGL